MSNIKEEIYEQCQELFPNWKEVPFSEVKMADPKGFSSFTIGIELPDGAEPAAVLYRRLEGKENAILPFAVERAVFLLLAEKGIGPGCYHYGVDCRIEQFYEGRTLEASDLLSGDDKILRQIGEQLYAFHQLTPSGVTKRPFFELLFEQWGMMAKEVLEKQAHLFPEYEQEMIVALRQIYAPETLEKVKHFIPDGAFSFCHNDTYHGNIMKLDDGSIRLLDFEFSSYNHPAFDFSNLFAETVMEHKIEAYPHFRIANRRYTDEQIKKLIYYYLEQSDLEGGSKKEEGKRLFQATKQMLPLSHFMYAMASLPLAVSPIQKIRFIPYAYQRWQKFLSYT